MSRRFTISGRIQTEDASSATVGKVQGRFEKLSNFLNVKFLASVAAAGAAIAGLTRAFTGSIRAAIDEERAINRLNAALRSAGTFTEAAAKASRDQADALEKTTGTSSRLVLEMEALARTFVASNDDARELTKTALDFASGAGIAFEEAIRRLGRGVQGAAGDIANFAPEIRELTRAQLAAGDATKILAERFEGQAAAAADTLEGKIKDLTNALENVQVAFGTAFTEALGAKEALDDTSRAIDGLNSAASGAGTIFAGFLNFLGQRAADVAVVTDGILDLTTGSDRLGVKLLEVQKETGKLSILFNDAATQAQRFAASEQRLADATADAVAQQSLQEKLLDRLNGRIEDADKILTDLGVTLEDDLSKGLKGFSDQTETLEKAWRDALISEREYTDGLTAIAAGILKLKGETAEATAETSSFADETIRATQANLELGGALDTVRVSASALRAEVDAVARSFISADFDRVARSTGLSAAVQAALAAGGTLSADRRRVNLPGGGSRFTFLEPGQQFDDRGGF